MVAVTGRMGFILGHSVGSKAIMDLEETIERKFIVFFQLKGKTGTIAKIVEAPSPEEAALFLQEEMGEQWVVVAVEPFDPV